jgi:hypothetical protein
MEKEKHDQCPNCTELWKRIDKLTEEKVKHQRMQGVQIVISSILFILIILNFGVSLLTR